jgi:hypothetical protein
MSAEEGPVAAERAFFTALVKAEVDDLDQILAEDFLLIDVMSGSEIAKDDLMAVLGSGQLQFDSIEPSEQRVRHYPTTAVITGRTQMSGRFDKTPFTLRSRYTHVYVEQGGRWRLVSAQGTQIVPEAG